jgi:hypothetical protein
MFKIQLADGNGDDGDDDAAANAAANVAATNALLPVNPKRIKDVVGRFQNDRITKRKRTIVTGKN